MGDEIGKLFIRIGTDLTDLHLGIGKGGKADNELQAFTNRVNGGLGSLLKFGAALGAIGVVGIAVGLGLAAKSAADFQAQMRLLTTQAGASNAEMENMSKGVLDMAASVGTAPEVLAQGLYHLESAGFRGATALDALRIAAEGAKVGNANLEDVTNALDAVLVAGVPEAKDMTGAMGELNAIVGAGDMRMQDLADAMGTGILASAKVFGLGLKDVGAALAVMGDNNIRGSDAATKLRMSISLMGATTSKAAAALKKVGIGSTELAEKMRSGGLVAALKDLQDHLKKSGLSAVEQARVLSEAFGGGKSAGTILLLLEQLDRLKTKEADITAGAGGFQKAWQQTQQNFTFQWDAATAALSSAGIKIGSVLLPYVSQLLEKVTPLIPKLADWATSVLPGLVKQIQDWANDGKPVLDFLKWALANFDTIKNYAIGIGIAWAAWNVGLKVTAALNMIEFLAQFVTQAYIAASATEGMSVAQWLLNIAMDANPIGLVILAVAALVAGFIWAYQNIQPFRDFVNGLWGDLGNFGQWLSQYLGPLLGAIGKLFVDLISGNWGAVVGDARAVMSIFGAKSGGGGGAQSRNSFAGRSSGIQSFDTGGMVPGPLGSAQLAIVHGGEKVLTPAQQRQGGGGDTYISVPVRTNADPHEIARAIVWESKTR